MAKITIIRRADFENALGKASLYVLLYLDRKKILIPVGISVTKNEWDPIKERIKGAGKDTNDRNLILANTRAKITDIFVRARLEGNKLTKEEFLAIFNKSKDSDSFVAFARRHLDNMRKVFSWETQKQHTAVLKKLDKYQANLRFDQITYDFLRQYAAYLRDKIGNNPTTVAKNLSVIRLYYYAGIRAGIATKNPFETFKMPRAQSKVVFLTEDELNSLIKLYTGNTLADNELETLRFFLFMTFTGMHITDARMLQIEQIFGGEIHYTRIKTKTKVSVPISKPAKKLIEFYAGGRYHGNLFQKLPSDQAFNRLIKRVASRAGITKPISAKCGRHTFATLYYKRNNGDIGTLSRLLGHTDIKTTMVYTHIMKDMRMAGIHAFDDFL